MKTVPWHQAAYSQRVSPTAPPANFHYLQPNQNHPMNKGPIVSILAGCLVAIAPVDAQTTTSPGGPSVSGSGKETIVMSPFEVTSTVDTGYVGQDTLAGSRLRTSLKDIAAAISPMTAEFLRDIAVTDVNSAMEYGLGTRVDTQDGSAAAVSGSYTSLDGAPRSIRIRGLPGGSRSLNFFGAPGELDTYMIEQVEVSRGPNSILYGFGSPAGIVNVSSKQALTDKNAHSVSHRIDSWGGQRWTADANLALIKNKLGVRAVFLRGRDESWRAAGHNDQDRIYLAGKWQIDRKTTLKFDFERGKADWYTPRPYFGIDLKSLWESSGRPMFNNFSPTYVAGTPGTGAVGTPGTPIRDAGATNVNGVVEIGADTVVVSDRFSAAQNYRQFTKSDVALVSGVQTPDFEMGRRNPEAVMEANWVGANGKQNFGSVYLQRELARGLHLELAFNRQTNASNVRNITWNYNGIAVDTNVYLPNGTRKPSDMLYYVDMNPTFGLNRSQLNQGRATISYEKEVPKVGRLRLGGLAEAAKRKTRGETLSEYWLKAPDVTSGGALNATPENNSNKVWYRYYISNPNDIYDPQFRVPGPYALSNPTKYQDPRTGALSDIYLHRFNISGVNTNYTDRNTGAYMGVIQAFLLKDRLVGTFGYRSDRLKNWIGVPIRDPAAEAKARNTGIWLPVDPSAAIPSVANGLTRTTGGVLHVSPWLSGFYNQSNSRNIIGTFFRTPSDPLQTARADLMPQPFGTTRDYGVKLSLLRNRVFVTATKFHTVSKNEGTANGARSSANSIWLALANSTALSADESTAALQRADVITQATQLVRDSESQGYELEIVGRPIPNWSVSLNYAKTKSAQSNIGREFRAYIDYWKPYWLKYRNLSISQNLTQPRPQYAPGMEDWTTPEVFAATNAFSTSIDSINEVVAQLERGFFDTAPIFEGRPFVGEPRHSFNLRTRYDFREGFVKGLSIGGGVRFRMGRVAGAKAVWHFAPGTSYIDALNGRVIDKTETVTAADQEVYDAQLAYSLRILNGKVLWRIQLNVNNVTNQRELVANNTDPITLAPTQYRYQDPRQFTLTNTFSF